MTTLTEVVVPPLIRGLSNRRILSEWFSRGVVVPPLIRGLSNVRQIIEEAEFKDVVVPPLIRGLSNILIGSTDQGK